MSAIHMTGISDFVQQSHNFIAAAVNLSRPMRRNGRSAILAERR
jgi:hypothetical protein